MTYRHTLRPLPFIFDLLLRPTQRSRSRRRRSFVPPLALLLGLLLSGCAGGASSQIEAQNGTLDLSGVTLEEPVRLVGTWQARRAMVGESPEAALAAPDSWRPVHIPAYFEDQGYEDEGAVWYRLQLRLPPTSYPLKGFIQHANNAHALYLARPGHAPVLLGSSGRPAASAASAVLSRAPASFSVPNSTEVVLLWKVSNFDYVGGGPFHPVVLGSAAGIDRMVLWRASEIFVLLGIFLIIGVSLLLYWWARRSELEILAIALLSLAMALRTPVTSGALEYLLPAASSFQLRILLEAVTFLLVPAFVALLLWGFFPHELERFRIGGLVLRERIIGGTASLTLEGDHAPRPAPRGWRIFNTAVLLGAGLVSLAFAVVALFSGPELTSYVLEAARWIYLLLTLAALVLLGQVVARRRPYALAVSIGTGMLLAAGAYDILLASGTVSGDRYIVAYGFLGFILAHTYALVRRYARVAERAQQQTEMLQHEISIRTKELRAATIASHAANLAKSHFLSAVSHELRSPLASILGYNRILKEELEEALEPQHREFFETIRASGERLTGLVNDILDVAKIEAGMLDLAIAPVDARQIIVEVIDQVYPLSRDKGLSIRRELTEGPEYVLADPVRLRQVLLNLISNAIKFTSSGEIVVSTHPAPLAGDPGRGISVSDTGPGISPDFLPQIFDRFTQEERLYNETQRGTGLGLSISRELITRMNGTIEVESVLNVGSTFTIILPLASDPTPAARPHVTPFDRALAPSRA